MSKEEFLKIQTCVLKVNIHCDGCEHKVKKILKKIDGVYTTKIDAEQGKVTVSGNVEPFTIIKKLAKSGKHAEIWGSKPPSDSNINQLKNMKVDNGKIKGQKGDFPPNPQLQLQQMKGFQDLKLPQLKDQKMPFNAPPGQNKKSVKFDIPDDDDDLSDDEFGDFDDDDDEFDDEFDDDDDEEDDMDDDPHRPLTKMKPVFGNAPQGPNLMMMNPQLLDAMKKNGGPKALGGAMPVQVSGGNGDKKGGGNGGNHNQGGGNGGNHNQGGGAMKNGGGAPKTSNNGGGGPNGNNMNVNGGAKKGAHQPMSNLPNGLQATGCGVGSMGQMGHMPMPLGGPIGSMPNSLGPSPGAVNGGGGGYFGAGPMPGNPNQNPMAAAAMMNQQRAMGNERFQPMMYARPPPEVNYMSPYPTPYPQPNSYPQQDPYSYPLHLHQYYPHPQSQGEAYTNYFDDENTSSCNVM